MDLLLGDVVAAGALADVEAARLAGEVQHGGIDQRVVEDEVRLGQTARRLAGEQVGIAGAGADERDEAAHCGRLRVELVEGLEQERAPLRHGHALRAPLRPLRARLHQPALEVVGQHGLQGLAQQAGQGRGFAVARDGHRDAAAGQHAARVGAARLGVVDGVDEHAALLGRGPAPARFTSGGRRRHHQPGAVEVGGPEARAGRA